MKIIRGFIGTVASAILVTLSVAIHATVVTLGWLGVDISDTFRCETRVDLTDAEVGIIARLRLQLSQKQKQINKLTPNLWIMGLASQIYENPGKPDLTRDEFIALADFICSKENLKNG